MIKLAKSIMSGVLIGAIGLSILIRHAHAQDVQDYLLKVEPELREQLMELFAESVGESGQANTRLEDLGFGNWLRVQAPGGEAATFSVNQLSHLPGVLHFQPNYKIRLYDQFAHFRPLFAERLAAEMIRRPFSFFNIQAETEAATAARDNPAFPTLPAAVQGPDPLLDKQWGMLDIGVEQGWEETMGSSEMIVAVIDTGVDYTHEDLAPNLWQNPGETGMDEQGNDRATNGIDDDGNGYEDDVIGWDFAKNDNKPYDLAARGLDLLSGGNPGHGTHCAGNVAAVGDNSKGVAGVAPKVRMMALRFLSEDGVGTTADAIKAIRYAVDNGAKVLSNSWGSEGESEDEAEENQALRDVIRYAMDQGRLFVAAAGNGHQGVGYDNDTDRDPAFPASYDIDNIVSVAAIDKRDNLGIFSNWGKASVDIGAPGVKVFSTTVDSKYSDTVFSRFGFNVYWDGTSMATPHVAGAAALYWSLYPEKTWQEVKEALLSSAKPIDDLEGKSVSGGKLDVAELMKR